MLNVYYPNAVLMMILVVEALREYAAAFRRGTEAGPAVLQLLAKHVLFAAVTLLCLLPTFVTRYIVYGSPFESGYGSVQNWAWRSPYFIAVLFSSEHGLFSWTPLLSLAIAGLILFKWREPRVGTPLLAAALAFYVFIACYPDWAGISSFGNRFFVSLTPLFILGLSVLFERVAALFRSQLAAVATVSLVLAAFVLWNAAFMLQWGAHRFPPPGPLSRRWLVTTQ